MKIGGLIKFTLIDYPAVVSAVVFTQGCNFHCRYCHNPELVYPSLFSEGMPQEEVMAFLRRRQGTLQGLVVTGGEPTLQPDLLPFLQEVKQLGYLIKLDTNGYKPEVLQQALDEKLLNYIAMDLKAPLAKYEQITGVHTDENVLQTSIDLIKNCGLPHEFRTTYDKTVLTEADLENLRRLVQGHTYRVQECLPVPKEKNVLKVQHTEI